MDFSIPEIPIQDIDDSSLSEAGIKLSILRTDLVHPVLSGNKWFKLKHNLIRAHEQGKETLLSFGGAWSNHLHALAFAGKKYGFKTIGLVRGEIRDPLNACLEDAIAAGMQLVPIDRTRYRLKDSPSFLEELSMQFGDFYLIPAGGANRDGVSGCREIPSFYEETRFDLVCIACGTGTSLTGLASVSKIPVMGFQVVKGDGYLASQVGAYMDEFGLKASCHWSVNDQYHFGGFAKVSSELLRFLTDFEAEHNVPLEPVYSGKLLYGIYDLVKKRDIFPQKCSILAIHGGGLQGRRGFNL